MVEVARLSRFDSQELKTSTGQASCAAIWDTLIQHLGHRYFCGCWHTEQFQIRWTDPSCRIFLGADVGFFLFAELRKTARPPSPLTELHPSTCSQASVYVVLKLSQSSRQCLRNHPGHRSWLCPHETSSYWGPRQQTAGQVGRASETTPEVCCSQSHPRWSDGKRQTESDCCSRTFAAESNPASRYLRYQYCFETSSGFCNRWDSYTYGSIVFALYRTPISTMTGVPRQHVWKLSTKTHL